MKKLLMAVAVFAAVLGARAAELTGTQGLAVEPTIIEAQLQGDLVTGTPEILNQPATGYRGVWYYNQKLNSEYVYKYSGGLGAYCAGHIPMAIYAPEVNKTFFTFGGTTPNNLTLLQCVSSFDNATKMLGVPTIVYDKHTSDAHDNAVLGLDDNGYLYLFSSSHGQTRPSAIARSKRPYDCAEFETVYTGNFSYPQPYFLPGKGFLFIHTAYQSTIGNRANYVSYFNPSTCQMSTPRQLCYINEGDYLRSWQASDGRIGIAFDQHPSGKPEVGLNYRTDLFYMETRDGGETWVTADGTELMLPITSRETPARVFSYADKNLNVYIKGVAYDAASRPYVLYIVSKGYQTGPENDPRQWKVAHYDGAQWIEHDTGIRSGNNYDFGQLEVLANGDLRIIGATERGPQPYNPGGEIAVWVSQDGGTTWVKTKDLTTGSVRNQNYPRRVLGGAHSGFLTFWADGDGRKPSVSRLSYCDEDLNVFPMPLEIGDAPQTELPSEYARLVYIRGQGEQWINTGFTPLSTDSAEMRIVLQQRDKTECLFCARDANAKNTFTVFSYKSANIDVGRFDICAAGDVQRRFAAFPVKKPCTFVVDGNSGRVAKDGVECEITLGGDGKDTRDPFTVGSPLVFFASHKGLLGPGNYGTFEMYGAVIRDRFGKVKKNYVPSMRRSDNAVGLYETIEGKFCVNSGAGGFAYEIAKTDVVYVDKEASSDNQPPYDSQDNAVNSIQKGLEWLKPGGKMILAEKQTWNFGSAFSSTVSFSLVGPGDRSAVLTGEGVTVNANQSFENVTFLNDVVTVNAGGVISNCVVRGGLGEAFYGRALVVNGGLAVDTTIEGFKGNGVWMDQNKVSTLERCVIRNGNGALTETWVGYSSVAILPNATAILRDCVITNNISRCRGSGGILGYAHVGEMSWDAQYDYKLILERCVVAGNQGRCGAMRLCNKSLAAASGPCPLVYATNCLFACNRSVAVESSGASATIWGRGEFVNCTIAGNSPNGKVFHLANESADSPKNVQCCKLINTIVSGNGSNVPTYNSTYGPVTARNSIFSEAGGADYAGKGNLTGPAIFCGTGETPYALKKNSPGYGTGDASIWGKWDVDLEGKTRLNYDGSVDMGCYRSHSNSGLLLIFL